ncbi:protein of unknown function [Paenibacillus alvei]|uniref:Uncharacterized protein n=1 Tax=Paenibacillus alvei TaxID=44250 RepID=A0A383RHD5_PAEAL|nr:protein of unknown function [Paenibacillus alvei]
MVVKRSYHINYNKVSNLRKNIKFITHFVDLPEHRQAVKSEERHILMRKRREACMPLVC